VTSSFREEGANGGDDETERKRKRSAERERKKSMMLRPITVNMQNAFRSFASGNAFENQQQVSLLVEGF